MTATETTTREIVIQQVYSRRSIKGLLERWRIGGFEYPDRERAEEKFRDLAGRDLTSAERRSIQQQRDSATGEVYLSVVV